MNDRNKKKTFLKIHILQINFKDTQKKQKFSFFFSYTLVQLQSHSIYSKYVRCSIIFIKNVRLSRFFDIETHDDNFFLLFSFFHIFFSSAFFSFFNQFKEKILESYEKKVNKLMTSIFGLFGLQALCH